MVNLAEAFGHLVSKKILLLGDLMLDAYIFGEVRRISPEGPVPVVQVKSEEYRAGGAGNVALNLSALGAQVSVLGRIGVDQAGEELLKALENGGCACDFLIRQADYPTTVKQRVLGNRQQMLRLDRECTRPLPSDLEELCMQSLPERLAQVDAVAVSDYAKGFLGPRLLRCLIQEARKQGKPVIVDPKGKDFSRYKGASVIKPNESEAYLASGLAADTSLNAVARRLLDATEVGTLVITRSEKGISIFEGERGRQDHPVRVREVRDVTGAGDTVLAMLTVALANNLSVSTAVEFCNLAAGLAIEAVGCKRVFLSEVAWRLMEMSTENRIFSGESLQALSSAQAYEDCAAVELCNLDEELETSLKQLCEMQSEKERLIVHVQESSSAHALRLVSAFAGVSFVVRGGSFDGVCETLGIPQEKQFRLSYRNSNC